MKTVELRPAYIIVRPKGYGKRIVETISGEGAFAHLGQPMPWNHDYSGISHCGIHYLGGKVALHCHFTKGGKLVCDRISKEG